MNATPTSFLRFMRIGTNLFLGIFTRAPPLWNEAYAEFVGLGDIWIPFSWQTAQHGWSLWALTL